MVVLAPTWLEYLAARAVIRRVRVLRCGIGAQRWTPSAVDEDVIICGLAGALTAGLEPGTVIVPESIATIGGDAFGCDPDMVAALRAGARRAGLKVFGGKMLTAGGIVSGAERDRWAGQGFSTVDMETAIVASRTRRVAGVRVILDSPAHPISSQWLHAGRASRSPSLWGEMAWLGANAPKYGLRAANVVRLGLRELQS